MFHCLLNIIIYIFFLSHKITLHLHSQTARVRKLQFLREGSPHPNCHVSCVMCHVSHVTFHMSHFTCHLSHIICLILEYNHAYFITSSSSQRTPCSTTYLKQWSENQLEVNGQVLRHNLSRNMN